MAGQNNRTRNAGLIKNEKGDLETMKKSVLFFAAFAAVFGMNVCSASASTLVYGSGDYTRINPAMDEHGEINILLFNGLTAHDGENQIVPGLAKSWEFDENTCTYTFHLE